MAVAVTAFFAWARHLSTSTRKHSARVCIRSKRNYEHHEIQITGEHAPK